MCFSKKFLVRFVGNFQLLLDNCRYTSFGIFLIENSYESIIVDER